MLWNCSLYRYENKITGEFHTKLIYACSRTAPSKSKLTIPKKELCSLLLGSEKGEYLRRMINIEQDNVFLHSDSMVAMFWCLQNPDKLKVYVSNRVKKIQQINFTILYVPGQENPADYTTKSTPINKYLNTEFWQNGPHLLKTNTDELISKYCIEYVQENTLSTKQSEELKAETKPVKAKILAQTAKETPHKIQDILETISSFSKILRITCYFLKFLSNTINGITDGNKRKHLEDRYFSKFFLEEPKGQFPGTFNPSQLKCATNFHIREAQAKIFLDEINSLKAKKNLSNSSKLSKLNPYLDESGVIRMDSRLEHHHMYPEQMTKPIILPGNGEKITEFIILDYHKKLSHGGPEVTLRELKLQYWLLGGRREIRQVLKACPKRHCKHQNLIETKQKEAKLPVGRGQIGNFERVALDYAGFFLKSKIVGNVNTQMKNVKIVGINQQKNKKKKVFAKLVKFGY